MRCKLTRDLNSFSGCIENMPKDMEFELNWDNTFVAYSGDKSYIMVTSPISGEEIYVPTVSVRFIEATTPEEVVWLNSYVEKNLKSMMLFCEVNDRFEPFPMFYNQQDITEVYLFSKNKETALRHILYDVMLEAAKEEGVEIYIAKQVPGEREIRLFDICGKDMEEPVHSVAGALVYFECFQEPD